MNPLTSILRRVRIACAACFGALAVSLVAPSLAYADVVQCANCTSVFDVFIGGEKAGSSSFSYDPVSGDIEFDTSNALWRGTNGASFRITSLDGNVDPILGFSFAASTGTSASSFAVSFDLPIDIAGQIAAKSSVTYALTALTGVGAQISPLGVGNKVVRAWDVDVDVGGGPQINKGVDVGDTLAIMTQGGTSQTFTASNMFMLGAGYELMTVSLDFFLTANAQFGVSGFVEQLVVPLPAALPLLLTGLIGFGVVARRRRGASVPAA